MDLGVMVDIWEDTEFTGAFEQAREAGFSHGQVNCYLPGITGEEVRRLAVAAANEGFHVDAVGCYVNPLRLKDSSLSKTNFDDWKTIVENMSMMNGVERIVCWSGTLGRTVETPNLLNQEEESLNTLFVTVSAMMEQIRGFPVKVLLEPYAAHVLSDADLCLQITKRFPSGDVRVVLDAPNIVPFKEVSQRDAHSQDLVRKVSPAVGLVHLRDLARGDGGSRKLTRPGGGSLNYGAYLRAITQYVPAVPVIVAGCTNSEEMKQARQFLDPWLRELAVR